MPTKMTTSFNHRHIGLEELVSLATTAHSLLGPRKMYKFMQDSTTGDSVMVSSCFRLLENLELTSSVGQLLSETVFAHQKVFHCGSGSMVFIAGAWSNAALQCLHLGIPIPHIIADMSEGLDICLRACRDNAVTSQEVLHLKPTQKVCAGYSLPEASPLSNADTLSQNPSESQHLRRTVKPLSHLTCHGRTQVNCRNTEEPPAKGIRHKVKLTHSRHFTSHEHSDSERPSESSLSTELDGLANVVSHGYTQAMDLVLQASRIQSSMSRQGSPSSVFDTSKLVTCLLPGPPEDQACALPGYVTMLSVEQASIARRHGSKPVRVLLLNGDLTDKHRHVGFNNPGNVRRIKHRLDVGALTREQEWLMSAVGILQRHDIGVVLVSGSVSEKLRDECWGCGVLLIERVKMPVLRDFAQTSGAIIVSYITQVNERCVGSGLRLQVWRECQNSWGKPPSTAVNVTIEGSSLVTVVITSSVHGKLLSLEDQFWGCAYRLHHALQEGKVVLGGGWMEIRCIRALEEHVDKTDQQTGSTTTRPKPYRGQVLRLMADGLADFVSTLLCNSGLVSSKPEAWLKIKTQLKSSQSDQSLVAAMQALERHDGVDADMGQPEEKVYDNVTVKMEAWRRALDLVFLVLQTDCEIIIGCEDVKTSNLMPL